MNIRNFYFFLIVVLSLSLLFEWTSENKDISTQAHLEESIRLETDREASGGFVTINSNELSLVISVESGAIVETRLKKYPVEMVDNSYGYRVLGKSGSSAFSYYFKSGFTGAVVPKYELDYLSDDYVRLRDVASGLSKIITFYDAPYEISIKDFSDSGDGKPYAALYRTSGRSLDLKTDALSGGMMNNSSYEGVAVSTSEDPYETSRLRSIEEPQEYLTKSGWIAFVQKYFFAAILGSENYVYNYYVLPKQSGLYRMGYTVESSDVDVLGEHEHRLFVGPKIRKDLMLRAKNLELAIDMGWFWFLAQPMVLIMDLINGYVNNWGLTIIIFTLLIKLLFWPLTAKSFKSMAAMKKIQPELREVQERYKNDRQKAAPETMKLMKKHGANPLGGCLPILITMPFFIGFFFALREMVELRHSDLGFWTDLSSPDPFFILPVLFCLVMYLTQRLNPQPAGMDPTQAQIMKYMPVMFSVLFIFFPTALCLYTVVNSAVQLAQQSYLYKQLGALSSN